MRVLHHLNSRVAAISEAATAVHCMWRSSGRRRQCWSTRLKMHMLASVVAVWGRLRDELQEKHAGQTEAQQRKSIYRMIDKPLEVKTMVKTRME